MWELGNTKYKLFNTNCLPIKIESNNLKFGITKKIGTTVLYDGYSMTSCRELYYNQIANPFCCYEASMQKHCTVIEKNTYKSITSKNYLYSLLVSTLIKTHNKSVVENPSYINRILHKIEEDLNFKHRSTLVKINIDQTTNNPDIFLLKSPIEWFYGGPLVSAYLLFIKVLLIVGNSQTKQIIDLDSFIENVLKKNKVLLNKLSPKALDSLNNWGYVLKNYMNMKDIIDTYSEFSFRYGIQKAAEKFVNNIK